MAVFNNILAGSSGQAAGGAGGYAIERSLRFNSADSAYLDWTPDVAGNRKTWTWAGWVKVTPTSVTLPNLFCAGDAGVVNRTYIRFNQPTGTITTGNDGGWSLTTSAVYRDSAAWYHLVVSVDTTQALDADRIKVWMNGAAQVLSGTSATPDEVGSINNNKLHYIGRETYTAGREFDGYLADVHFIDGQALDPTSFGEFDDNGIWQPIDASGLTYGTNGFHLDFADNSTAAALGTDAAGSNDWTVNNISVAAGADNDSLVDVPTNGTEEDTGVGGEVRGNYATWNPISKLSATPAPVNGNLTVNGGNASYAGSLLTTIEIPKTGKWYWEVTSDSSNWQNVIAGVADVPDPTYVSATNIGNQAAVYLYYAYLVTVRGSIVAAVSPTYTTGTAGVTYGFAADMDNGDVYLYHNGTIQNSGSPIFTNLNSVTTPLFPATTVYNVEHHWNFGQRPFAYPVSGYKSLNTASLPAPTIEDGSDYMDVVTYTGTSATNTVPGLGFSNTPGLIWIKNRTDNSTQHVLQDIVRTYSTGTKLSSSSTEDEGDTTVLNDSFGYISGASSTGFTLEKSGTGAADWSQVNLSTKSYVGWCWDAGSSTVSNTDGSITSSVRANPSVGFSIVSYTGTGANATVGHGLGAAPKLVIVKNRDASGIWPVFHIDMGGLGKYLILDNPTRALNDGGSYWQNTAPTSTLLYLGAGLEVNADTQRIIAYCFAPVAGYSAFGSYTGNGSADGPFVYTGFRPRWVMIKSSSSGGTYYNWDINDTARNTYNATDLTVCANLPDSENSANIGTQAIDILSNGFKVRQHPSTSKNVSGDTYIYAAFAENPFALNARAR